MIDATYLESLEDVMKYRSSVSFYTHDLLTALNKEDRDEIIDLDEKQAVASGAYNTVDDYRNRRFELDRESIGGFISEDNLVYNNVMLASIIGEYSSGDSRVFRKYLSALRKSMSPEYCASVVSKRALHEVLVQDFSEEVNDLIYDLDKEDEIEFRRVQDLRNFLKETIPMNWALYDFMIERTEVKSCWGSWDLGYTYPPQELESRKILTPIELLIDESAKNPKLLFEIDPRTLEKIVADIFSTFGFQVELTSRAKDGGCDVICLSQAHGIPIKIAFEVKRYSENRPVGVELVRSFVGANKLIDANKLVFVTTSRFTRGAREYANSPFVSSLLELREMPDIIEWCKQSSLKRYGQQS